MVASFDAFLLCRAAMAPPSSVSQIHSVRSFQYLCNYYLSGIAFLRFSRTLE